MNSTKSKTIIGIILAIALGLALSIINININNSKKEAHLQYLSDKEAIYSVRYGHPEVENEIKSSFDKRVLPELMAGAEVIIDGLSNPLETFSKSEEGQFVLSIFEELNFIK